MDFIRRGFSFFPLFFVNTMYEIISEIVRINEYSHCRDFLWGKTEILGLRQHSQFILAIFLFKRSLLENEKFFSVSNGKNNLHFIISYWKPIIFS